MADNYVGFKPDYEALGRFLAGEEMQADMKTRANKMKEFAQGIAPRDADTDEEAEHYADKFEVKGGVTTDHGHKPRAYADLRNTSDHAEYVEFGNGKTRGHHVLLKSLDAAG